MRLYFLQYAMRPSNGVPVPGYVIQTEDLDGGSINILIDSGWARSMVGAYEREGGRGWRVTEEDYVVNRLAQAGLRPADISMVVCTHLDPDHAGGHDQFPAAQFIAQRAHYAEATSGRHERFGYPGAKWNDARLKYTLVDGDAEVARGVRLLETSGHVPGHQSVLLRLPQTGAVILAADAITSAAHLDPDTRPIGAYDMDAAATRASTRKLVELARQTGAWLIYGHDAEQWRGLRKAPEYYA